MLRAHDGRGPQTQLTAPVLAQLGAGSVPEVVGRLAAGPGAWGQLAALAPICTALAKENDDSARTVVMEAGKALASGARSVAVRLGLTAGAVVATGGAVLADPVVRGAFVAALEQCLPAVMVVAAAFPPVLGAALLALQAAGGEMTDTVIARMARPAT